MVLQHVMDAEQAPCPVIGPQLPHQGGRQEQGHSGQERSSQRNHMSQLTQQFHALPSAVKAASLPQGVLQHIFGLAADSDLAVLQQVPLVSRAWAAALQPPSHLRVHLGAQGWDAEGVPAFAAWLQRERRAEKLRALSITLVCEGNAPCLFRLLGAIHLPGLTRLELHSSRRRTTNSSLWELGGNSMRMLVQALPQLACLQLGYELRCSEDQLSLLHELPHLTQLSCAYSGVQCAAALARLTRLRSLAAYSPGIGGKDAGTLGAALTQLTHLKLADNYLLDASILALAPLGCSLHSLDIRGNEASPNTMAALIPSLTNLTSLDMTISIGGDNPDDCVAVALASLTRLHQLEVSGISDAGLRILAAALTQLTELTLGRGVCCVPGISDLVSLTALKGLARLSCVGPIYASGSMQALASALSNLTSLDVNSCQLNAQDAQAIARMHGLRSLSVAGNNIGDAGVCALAAALTQLTQLSVSFTMMGAAGTAALAQLTNLMVLRMARCTASVACLAKLFKALPDLASLDLGNGTVGSEHAPALTALTKVTHLDLRKNHVGEAGLRAVAQLTQLRSLDLTHNNLYNVDCMLLAPLTRLTLLYTSGSWSSAQREHLEAALPYLGGC